MLLACPAPPAGQDFGCPHSLAREDTRQSGSGCVPAALVAFRKTVLEWEDVMDRTLSSAHADPASVLALTHAEATLCLAFWGAESLSARHVKALEPSVRWTTLLPFL